MEDKKMKNYAAVIKVIRKADGDVDYKVWGGWTDSETAAEVLENLKAAYGGKGMEIIEEMVLPTDEAWEMVDAFYAI